MYKKKCFGQRLYLNRWFSYFAINQRGVLPQKAHQIITCKLSVWSLGGLSIDPQRRWASDGRDQAQHLSNERLLWLQGDHPFNALMLKSRDSHRLHEATAWIQIRSDHPREVFLKVQIACLTYMETECGHCTQWKQQQQRLFIAWLGPRGCK